MSRSLSCLAPRSVWSAERGGEVHSAQGHGPEKLARFTELTQRLAEDYSEELLDELGRLQEQLDHREPWDLDSRLEQAIDALRCPPPDTEVATLSGG